MLVETCKDQKSLLAQLGELVGSHPSKKNPGVDGVFFVWQQALSLVLSGIFVTWCFFSCLFLKKDGELVG